VTVAKCTSKKSGDIKNLISPLRSCPFRCQHKLPGWGLTGGSKDCIVDHRPVFATVDCAACEADSCMAKVPDACLEAGALQAGFTQKPTISVAEQWKASGTACDASSSNKKDYLTSPVALENALELSIRPEEYKRCTFECQKKYMLGMNERCVDEVTNAPILVSEKCPNCMAVSCGEAAELKCINRDAKCDARLAGEYKNYLVDTSSGLKCTFKCLKKKQPTGALSSIFGAGDERCNTVEIDNKTAPVGIDVEIGCFDCTDKRCLDQVVPKCQANETTCDSPNSGKPSNLIKSELVNDPVEEIVNANVEMAGQVKGLKYAQEDTRLTDQAEFDRMYNKPMAVTEVPPSVEEQARRELEGRIAFDRWLNFAKVKNGCDTFPFCNHIPNPPPLLPSPLDMASPRANIKMPYVPPRMSQPHPMVWDGSKLPIVGSEAATPPPYKYKPGVETVLVNKSPLTQSPIANTYDTGIKTTEFEDRPFTKSGTAVGGDAAGWAFQYNMYHPALGNLDNPDSQYEKKTASDTYPDWANPKLAEENWKLLAEGSFGVFDSGSESDVKGYLSQDPSIKDNGIGDIPEAPLDVAQRQESFIANSMHKSKAEWDKSMSREGIPIPGAAVAYLNTIPVDSNCDGIEDRQEQANCISRQAQAARDDDSSKSMDISKPAAKKLRFRGMQNILSVPYS